MALTDTNPRDPAWAQAAILLACVVDRMRYYDAEPCRTFVAPGGPPAWDTCGTDDAGREGQVWVAIEQVYPTDSFPVMATGPARCYPAEHAAVLRVGAVRCAATVDEQGNPPSSERLTEDSWKVARDRAIIRDAIRCCYLEDADPGTYTLGAWTPLGPNGGCVGGSTVLTVALAGCGCPNLEVGQ